MRLIPYRSFLLIVLMVLLAFNFADRIALGLVLENIKADLHLTDTQLGFLSGIAFALFYSVMGIPIARWADQGNRVTIIVITTALWSVMVALCGLATTFTQLLLIRVVVGVGEAGCIPPANSLIGEYFTRAERPRATAIYMQGLNLSPILAYLVSGWLAQFYGWRTMFVVLGLPGICLAALAWSTLREPRRTLNINKNLPESLVRPCASFDSARAASSSSLREVFSILWRSATFRHLLYSFSVFYFFVYGTAQWQPAYFVRRFGMSSGELGTWFSLVQGLFGLIGTYLGGLLASRYAPNNERLQFVGMAITNAVFNAAVWALIYCTQTYEGAFAWMGLSTLGGMTILGPMFAMTQTLVPSRMRAVAISVIYLFANLIGMGLGPLAVGMMSDALRPLYGQDSLRYALLLCAPGFLWVSWHLWQASKTVDQDLALIKDNSERCSAPQLVVI